MAILIVLKCMSDSDLLRVDVDVVVGLSVMVDEAIDDEEDEDMKENLTLLLLSLPGLTERLELLSTCATPSCAHCDSTLGKACTINSSHVFLSNELDEYVKASFMHRSLRILASFSPYMISEGRLQSSKLRVWFVHVAQDRLCLRA